MARRSIADLHATLRVDGSRLRSDITKSNRILRRQLELQATAINRAFSRALTAGLTGAFAGATAAAAGLTAAVNRSRQEIDSLGKDSERIGLATEQLQALRLAAEESGASAEALTSALARMQDAISDAAAGVTESQGLLQAFQDLNLEFDELINLDPTSQFIAVADAIARVRNEADRTRLTRDIFGRGGVTLAPLLRGDVGARVAESRGFLGSVGATIRTFEAREVEKMNDALGRLGVAVGALINQLTIQIAPTITSLAQILTREIGELNKKIPELDVFENLGDTVEEFGKTMERAADKVSIVGKALDRLATLLQGLDVIFTILGAGAGLKAGAKVIEAGYKGQKSIRGGLGAWAKEYRHFRDLDVIDRGSDVFTYGLAGRGGARGLKALADETTEDVTRSLNKIKRIRAGGNIDDIAKMEIKNLESYVRERQKLLKAIQGKTPPSAKQAADFLRAADRQDIINRSDLFTKEFQDAAAIARGQGAGALQALFSGAQSYAAFKISGFIDDVQIEIDTLRKELKATPTASAESYAIKEKLFNLTEELNGKIDEALEEAAEEIRSHRLVDNIISQGVNNSGRVGVGRDEQLRAMESRPILDQLNAAHAQSIKDAEIARIEREERIQKAPAVIAKLQEDIKRAATHITFVGRAGSAMKSAFDHFRVAIENVPYKEIETHIINLERTLKSQVEDIGEELAPDSRAFRHPFGSQIDELLDIRDTMKSINAETTKTDRLIAQFDAAGIRELGYQLENTADSLNPFTDQFKALKRDLDAIRETPMGDILADDINRITTLIEYTEAGVFQVFDALQNNIGTAIDQLIDTGKLNFRDFFAGILRDMAKIYARLLLFGQSGAGGLLGSIAFSVFGSVFGAAVLGPAAGALDFGFGGEGTATAIPGGGFGNTTGEVTTISNNPELLPGFAAGGRFDTRSPFVVGEEGPEVIVPRSAGYVVPNDAMGKMNGNPSFNITQNINAGVSQTELAFALEQAKQDLRREIMQDVTGGGKLYNAIEQITA